jgi:16S rRNA (guanine966-N2)-methyltransferase
MPRIIAGEFRSRKLHGPAEDASSRPYVDRIKESVFSILRGWFEDANVLDLFAGVGTMGLEAVSRGAARVMMVEKDRRVFQMLQQNIEELGCADRATAVLGDALGQVALQRAPRPLDIVFVDPPFEMMESQRDRRRVLDQIVRVRPLMKDKGFVVLRCPGLRDLESMGIEGFDGPEVHRYSNTMAVLLYAPAARGTESAAEAAEASDMESAPGR